MVSYQRLDLIRIHRKALGTIPFDYLREIARCPCRQNTNVHLHFLCISACPPLSTERWIKLALRRSKFRTFLLCCKVFYSFHTESILKKNTFRDNVKTITRRRTAASYPLPHRNTSLLYLTERSQRCGYMCAMLHITHINLEKGREIHQQYAWAEITQAWGVCK